MGPASGPLRIFLALIIAAVPVLLLGVAAPLLPQMGLTGFNSSTTALILVAIVLVWAAVLAIVYSRTLRADLNSILALARRGRDPTDESGVPEGYRRVAAALEERNRQVAVLAAQSSTAPISGDARPTASHVTATAQRVTGDPTWRLAVMRTGNAELLPVGVYHGVELENPGTISELEQWASTAGDDPQAPVHRVEGPWGAFVIVRLATSDSLTAILYAPWEGRPPPSAAQLDLLNLVGQHASTALEHALLYARVRAQSEAIDRMAEVQRDFLRSVSHDLQTPLTSIQALAAELRSTKDADDAAIADLDDISFQADRLRRMVGQLLAVSRLEAGALAPRLEVLSVAPLVERVWRALRADRKFTLETEGAKLLAIADPDRLEQVLWAILDNAVKYSPEGSLVSVQLRPAADDRLAIAVRDQGAGMDADSVSHAFDQFYRSPHATRLAIDGSGVGLYAARGLMQAMGGEITLTSKLGAGTTVTCLLPAELVESEELVESS
ncbi:MAG TPA: GAF domain-containing sensor histidine kinase [Candidatus Limnocylindria bacterium]